METIKTFGNTKCQRVKNSHPVYEKVIVIKNNKKNQTYPIEIK